MSLRPAALAGVPLAFAAGALVARLLSRAPAPQIAVDFKQPLVVVTAWGAHGLDFFVCFAAAIVLATIALAYALGPRWNAGPSLPATLLFAAFALGAGPRTAFAVIGAGLALVAAAQFALAAHLRGSGEALGRA